jgi:pimeloyl-ACP methyl ester carboxylesterase
MTIDCGDASLACEIVQNTSDQELCICAHGFPDCVHSFRHQIDALCGIGMRVAIPSMRGYAPSGRARSHRYHAGALGRDLLSIADALSPHAPVVLVGHDWGALAAYAAAALAPERVRKLVTLALPHPRVAGPRWLTPAQLRRSWYIGFFQLRALSERTLVARNGALVERLWRDWSPGYRASSEELELVKRAVLAHPSAVLGYYREIFRPGSWRRLVLRRTRVPALYLHGVDDGCIGVELVRGVERGYAAGIDCRLIEGAGHFVHLERPELVNRHLVEFLSPA